MQTISIIQPLDPEPLIGWQKISPRDLPKLGYPIKGFTHRSGLVVFSAVEVTRDVIATGEPYYHISISKKKYQRCDSLEALWVLRQFNITEAEEDNHIPDGRVRHFWRPVADPRVGIECPCKEDEPVMKENKGDFIWRGVTNE